MEKEFIDYLKKISPSIEITDFPSIERSFKFSLRYELGDDLENGTIERVNQATERGCIIFNQLFKNENEFYILTYDWTDELFGVTPEYISEILGLADYSNEMDLALMHFGNEEIEYEKGILSIFKRKSETFDVEKILNGIANLEMGFEPTIHQITYFFGVNNKKLFWMYDDRGCLAMSQKNDFDLDNLKNWLVKINNYR